MNEEYFLTLVDNPDVIVIFNFLLFTSTRGV